MPKPKVIYALEWYLCSFSLLLNLCCWFKLDARRHICKNSPHSYPWFFYSTVAKYLKTNINTEYTGGSRKKGLAVLTTSLTVLYYCALFYLMRMVTLMKDSLNLRPNFEKKKGLATPKVLKYLPIWVMKYLLQVKTIYWRNQSSVKYSEVLFIKNR